MCKCSQLSTCSTPAAIRVLQARQIWEALLYAQPGVRESDAGAAAFETLVSL